MRPESGTLVIDISRERAEVYEGVYQCIARNKHGTAVSNGIVVRQSRKSAPCCAALSLRQSCSAHTPLHMHTVYRTYNYKHTRVACMCFIYLKQCLSNYGSGPKIVSGVNEGGPESRTGSARSLKARHYISHWGPSIKGFQPVSTVISEMC